MMRAKGYALTRCAPRPIPLLASWHHNRPPGGDLEVRQPPTLTLEGPHRPRGYDLRGCEHWSAFHTLFTRQTNSTLPPSVRTYKLRIQECSHHKGSLRPTSRISSLLTSMRICALGLGSK